MADKAELCFVWIYLFDAANLINGFVLKNITAQTINGIGGVDDEPSIHQAFGNHANMPWVGV
jgi:hypothetical protein